MIKPCKKPFTSLAVILLSACLSLSPCESHGAESKSLIINGQNTENVPLPCRTNTFQLKFDCNINWNYTFHAGRLEVRIIDKPEVMFTIEKLDTDIRMLGQLTKKRLKRLGHYQKGFATEWVHLDEDKVLKVKAFSSREQNTRVSDYFFIRDHELFALRYSISPIQTWKQEQFFVKKIFESFRLSEPTDFSKL